MDELLASICLKRSIPSFAAFSCEYACDKAPLVSTSRSKVSIQGQAVVDERMDDSRLVLFQGLLLHPDVAYRYSAFSEPCAWGKVVTKKMYLKV